MTLNTQTVADIGDFYRHIVMPLERIKTGDSPSPTSFSYDEAFSRNLGWVTAQEQKTLQHKRIAIAGLGGVGGFHLLTLTRLGIGSFHIADFDNFELANFNRQAGASVSSLDKSKADVMTLKALDINPSLGLKTFNEAIDEHNLNAFLDGVDVYVDSLDFFAVDARRKIFARCRELGIPAITAAPLGMSTALLIFMPDSMSFDDYFRLEGLPKQKQYVNFLLGLSPALLQRSYLMDSSRVDLANKRGPSVGLSCELCAGAAAAQALKILLKRGPIKPAPSYYQFDAYHNKLKRGWLPGGNANPFQRIKLFFAYRLFERMTKTAQTQPKAYSREIEAILDQSRWAPSGDNTQPWRFEIVDDDHLIVHLTHSAEDIYDYPHGHATLLAGGTLLETMRVAASRYNRSLAWSLEEEKKGNYRINVTLKRDPKIAPDPLIPFIPIRSVDRRAYRTTALMPAQKQVLEQALGDEFGIIWRETFAEHWQATALNMMATDIRLRIPEAYVTHKKIVDWQNSFSETGIPQDAVGLDRITLRLMRWLMRDWKRIDFMNRFGGGTRLAQLEMDVIPGLFCGAHFIIAHKVKPENQSPECIIRAGQAIQRFWLTAAAHGLALQPSFPAIVFAAYSQTQYPFTRDARMLKKADQLREKLVTDTGVELSKIAFMGRIGTPRSRRITARSIRRPLEELYVNNGKN